MASTRDLARDAAFLGQRDRFAEGDHLDHQQEIDRDLHLHGEAVGADIGHLGADRAQHRLDLLERRPVAADHDRSVALRQRHRAAGDRGVEHREPGLANRPRRRGSRRARSCSCRHRRCRLQAGDDAVVAERDRATAARIGHDGEHDVGDGGGGARRRRKSHAGLDQRLGLVLARFQPVTAWPAAMSRGTMPAPMAPSPTNPMFIHPPRNSLRGA